MTAMRAALGKPEPKPEEDMKFVQSVALAPTEIPPGGNPVVLRWTAQAGQPQVLGPGGEGASPGSGALISAVNVRIIDGGSLRLTLAEMVQGKPAGEPVNAEFSQAGGWVQFTAPFPSLGGTFEVTAANYGKDPAKLSAGTWQIVR